MSTSFSGNVTSSGMSANAGKGDLPQFIIKNIQEILNEAGPEGILIGSMGQVYFKHFNSGVYVEKYGFKNWGEALTCTAVKPLVTIFNSGQSVRSSRFSTNTTSDSVQVLVPIVSSTSHGGDTPIPCSSKNVSDDTDMDVESVGTSAAGSRASRKRRSSQGGGDYEHENVSEVAPSESDITDVTHVSISPSNKVKLRQERECIRWIAKETGGSHLDINTLFLEREMRTAEPAMYIDCTYCDRDILEKLMDIKSLIKKVNTDRFAEIRNKHNKFEFEKGSIFQHGSAIKMANIDALMGHALSNPKNPDGSSMLVGNELLYFADVNGGPGGFAEYFLWKKKWQAKGFGITPRGKNDYNLQQAEHFPRESFEVFYGESGQEGSGNIARPFFLSKFITFVKESTDEKGVHVMVANGGDTDDYVDEDQKEIRCKYIFMSQFLLALKIVRQGGHYVSRVYDMYTPFTVELIYLMYRTFDNVAIFKPESSLPASSEKYIICKWRKSDAQVQEISNYLSECHKMDWLTRRNTKNQHDFAEIVHLVNPSRLHNSGRFYKYIRDTNSDLGRRQIQETTTMSWNIKNNHYERYIQDRLNKIQNNLLCLWGVPTKVREIPKYAKATTPKIRGIKLLTPYPQDFIGKTESEGEVTLFMSNMAAELKRPKQWRFMPVGKERGFFLCLGGNQIYKFIKGNWIMIKENMELMNNTLVYADLVDEIYITGAKQSSVTALHIIDAMVLGSKDIRMMPHNERYDLIQKYSASLNKISRNDLAPIRAKVTYELSPYNLQRVIQKMVPLRSRNGTELICPIDAFRAKEAMFYPKGVLFIKTLNENFSSVDFRFCLQNRVFWHLTSDLDLTIPEDVTTYTPKIGLVIKQDENGEDKPLVHAAVIVRHLHEVAVPPGAAGAAVNG